MHFIIKAGFDKVLIHESVSAQHYLIPVLLNFNSSTFRKAYATTKSI